MVALIVTRPKHRKKKYATISLSHQPFAMIVSTSKNRIPLDLGITAMEELIVNGHTMHPKVQNTEDTMLGKMFQMFLSCASRWIHAQLTGESWAVFFNGRSSRDYVGWTLVAVLWCITSLADCFENETNCSCKQLLFCTKYISCRRISDSAAVVGIGSSTKRRVIRCDGCSSSFA